MPRGARRTNNNPESGYKFDCQWCEGEIYQGPPPALEWLPEEVGTGRNKQIASSSFQCCVDCAEEVRELRAEYMRENPQPTKQSRPLRDAETLAATLPDTAKQQSTSNVDAKLDKLIDCMSTMMQMMVMQMQMQQNGAAQAVASVATIKPAPEYIPPKPKRKVLAPPAKKTVKRSAPSASKKPQKRAKGTTTKARKR